MRLLIVFLLFYSSTYSQTIKRWPNGRHEASDKELALQRHSNIFDKFLWTFPDVGSRTLAISDGKASFDLDGKDMKVRIDEGDEMRLSLADLELSSPLRTSKNNIYYDKSKLKMKAITQQVWTSYTTYEHQQVPVQKTRMVTSYSYQNGKSVPQYRTESYTAYEGRSVPKTSWKYVPRTTWVLDIPSYDHYYFALPDSTGIIIYKLEGDQYRLQQVGYLLAKDEEDVNHVFIDVDANGVHFEDADRVMFNSWNPFSPTSTFKRAGHFMDNHWYGFRALRENNFLQFSIDPDSERLRIGYENSAFVDESDKGKVTFSGLPEKAKLFVNGKEYRVKKGGGKFKSQYGKFVARIQSDGAMDFEQIYVVDAEHPILEIRYVPTKAAGTVSISNIFQASFFVTITASDGFSQTLNGAKKFSVPTGKSTVTIYSDGFSLVKELDLEAGASLDINFEEEIKSLKAEEAPEEKKTPLKEEGSETEE